MRIYVPLGSALIAWSGISVSVANAQDLTVELARKCQELTTKAFPPRVPGNPAAGSAAGSGREQIDYYEKCVANNGNVPATSNTQTK